MTNQLCTNQIAADKKGFGLSTETKHHIYLSPIHHKALFIYNYDTCDKGLRDKQQQF